MYFLIRFRAGFHHYICQRSTAEECEQVAERVSTEPEDRFIIAKVHKEWLKGEE